MQSWTPDPEQAAQIEADREAAALAELHLLTGPWTSSTLTAADRRALSREK